jgi:hypothetical protein
LSPQKKPTISMDAFLEPSDPNILARIERNMQFVPYVSQPKTFLTEKDEHVESAKKDTIDLVKMLIKKNILKMMEHKRQESLERIEQSQLELAIPKLSVPKKTIRFDSTVKPVKETNNSQMSFNIIPV